MAGEPGEVHRHGGIEKDVEHVAGRIARAGLETPQVGAPADQAFRGQESRGQLRIVPGRAHGHHHRPGVHADLERFLGGDRKARRVGYLPFGAGPRVCIGNHFALVEAQLILAAWAQRFHFRLAQPAPVALEPLMTLRPKGGVWVEPIAR